MSEFAMTRARNADSAFAPLTIGLLLVIGLLGFAGSLLLGAYAPDFRSGRDAGTHALSRAATGYAGLVTLAEATGRHPRVIRDAAGWQTEDLVVATPDHGMVDMSRFMGARRGRATLIVLPKWAIAPQQPQAGGTPGWVDIGGLLPAGDPARTLAPATPMMVSRHPSGARPLRAVRWVPASLAVAAPRPLQVVRSAALTPLVTDDAGGIVLGWIANTGTYILADPDLLNNHGLRRLDRARAALDLLDFVNATNEEGGRATGVAFDVTLNGQGGGRSPLKLAFEPPFLALTLAIVVALALVGWQALVRFGAPVPPARAIAFGKTALIDNSALIVRKAGREGALGARYAAVIRARARGAFGVPTALTDAEADRRLDAVAGPTRFTDLVADATRVGHRDDMLAAARALHQWLRENIR